MPKEKTHILVVEDEEHLAIGIQYNLQAEGYQVTVQGEGRAALDFLRSPAGENVSLIVLDLMLPGMSGYAVCQELREEKNDVPVLILSARGQAEDRARGFDVGADQYLTKPFDLEELISRVRNLLSRRKTEPASRTEPKLASLEFGGAHVDFASYEVTLKDEKVRLTKLEAKLLQYFAQNQGRVIAKSELLKNVWGQPGTLLTRAPDQFIRRLRKLFEPDPAKPRYFLTVRDAGYKFVTEAEPAAEEELTAEEPAAEGDQEVGRMKGPYERLKYDLRRVWECPVCHHRERSGGDVTSLICGCQENEPPAQRQPMKLVEDGPRRVI